MIDDASFRPFAAREGYLPIEDFALIGDGRTAALVGRDGTVAWLCIPRFDDAPVFCSILDSARGGSFRLAPTEVVGARQRYERDTGVLTTEIRSPTGVVRITDCLTLRGNAELTEPVFAGRGELLRTVTAVEGSISMQVAVEPRGGAVMRRTAEGIRLVLGDRPDLDLWLASTVDIDGPRGSFQLRVGETAHFVLSWGGSARRPRSLGDFVEPLVTTRDAWRRWATNITYDGPQDMLVRRSALTLKMLDYHETGAVVAAPTSSLPEALGGTRNWDYRFSWVRDAAFSVYALRRVGLAVEARGFLGWVLDAIARDGRPSVLYTVDGADPPAERIDADLAGYRGSAPVRWGNAAAEQQQHDVYGEVLDCAYQWASAGGSLERIWPRLAELVDAAARSWSEPDRGIWEVRTAGRAFTYSAAMCQVALDRGARLSERLGFRSSSVAWRRDADAVLDAIMLDAWDDDAQAFTEQLGRGGGLDASLLALPLRRVVDARHPKMVATVAAIQRRLGAGDGLLYRYLPEESPDGIGGGEGAFLLCSFWLVDNLALQGRLDDAVQLYDSLCARANAAGLLPEQIDPTSGSYLGNFPQGFSHVGVISSGVNLAQLTGLRRDTAVDGSPGSRRRT